ncbi:TetR/AcrR family transcriptional regulator [Paenibacillus sp. HW567]|uniref:TetR/AcrR family transcriptional regulator n=1 Tax=Paenibacillus sp. HW567 TaxID=1034769 RepID=UPI0003798672|nr:TetR/AcrR family transcriptional regulator [Paenibacillus sp. HW567]
MPRTEEVNQQIRDDRREQILQAAAEMFLQKGVSNLKISELAAAAGMSQGLLYRYFSNKEEILATLVEQATQAIIQQMQEVLHIPESAYMKLYRLTEVMLHGIRINPAGQQLLLQSVAVPGKAGILVQEMGSLMKSTLHQLILDGQASGEVVQGDPHQLVVLYLCTIQGLTVGLHFFGNDTIEHFPDIDTVLRILKP